jgi:hypothetical protein
MDPDRRMDVIAGMGRAAKRDSVAKVTVEIAEVIEARGSASLDASAVAVCRRQSRLPTSGW